LRENHGGISRVRLFSGRKLKQLVIKFIGWMSEPARVSSSAFTAALGPGRARKPLAVATESFAIWRSRKGQRVTAQALRAQACVVGPWGWRGGSYRLSGHSYPLQFTGSFHPVSIVGT